MVFKILTNVVQYNISYMRLELSSKYKVVSYFLWALYIVYPITIVLYVFSSCSLFSVYVYKKPFRKICFLKILVYEYK